MSFDGHAASSSGCAIKPRARGTGSTAFVGRTGTFLRTGSYGNGRASGSRVTRECHARFWERLGVRIPRATRQTRACNRRDRRVCWTTHSCRSCCSAETFCLVPSPDLSIRNILVTEEALFDYLVGAGEERWRDGESERVGGPLVDD